jgi:hypothetical protein
MGTNMELTKDGQLKIAGSINTRLPAITDGLVAHFPFDGTEKGIGNKNMLDYSHWSVGADGSGNSFSVHARNIVELSMTPHGAIEPVLTNTVDETTSAYEGGWTNYDHPIDNTKTYRLSVWIKRENPGDGRTYFGCQGSTVCNLATTDGTVNTNPYFSSQLIGSVPQMNGGWVLWVAYIHPHDYPYTSSDPRSGIYSVSGQKILNIGDFKWAPTATVGGHRTYLYYSTTIGEKQLWYAPRMEMCDGTEPSIHDLLMSEGNVVTPSNSKIRYIRDWVNGSTANTGNHWTEIEAVDHQGINIALGKPATSTILTDGVTASSPYYSTGIAGTGGNYVEIDLEELYDIQYVRVRHYYADGRTYHNTKTEVSSDGANWFAIFDSAYDGEYPETPEGKEHYVFFNEATATFFESDGIAVEEGTTNLILNPTFINEEGLSSDFYSYNSTYEISDIVPSINIPSKLSQRLYYNTSSNDGTMMNKGIRFEKSNLNPNTQHVMTFFGKGWEEISGISVYLATVFKKEQFGEWTKYSISFTSDETGYTNFYIRPNSNDNYNFDCFIYAPQVEAKPFATSFTKGYRPKSKMTIDNIGGYTEYTIFGEFTPRTPFVDGDSYALTANFAPLIRVDDTVNAGGYYFRYWASSSVTSAPFIDPDGFYGTSHIHRYYEVEANNPIYYAIRKDGTNLKVKLKQNGVWKDEHILTTDALARLDKISFGDYSAVWNGVYKNLSIYNRALSDQEVEELTNIRSSAKPTGEIYSKSYISSLSIPSDVYYFPLGSDGKGIEKGLEPVAETNLSFKDGAAWIGHSIENKYNLEAVYSTWPSSTSNMATLTSRTGRNSFQVKGVSDVPGAYVYVYPSITTNANIISFSGKIKNNLNSQLQITTTIREYGNKSDIINKQETLYIKPFGCVEFSTTSPSVTTNTGYTVAVSVYSDSTTGFVDAEVFDIQLEENIYSTPFVSGTRGVSYLEYNLNSTLGLDWSGDWTIAYWKKAIGTSNAGALTGYSIDSLGSNSNSVGGGYHWWGKRSGYEDVSIDWVYTPYTQYFDGWQRVVIVKSGTNEHYEITLPDGQVISRDRLNDTIIPNYYVCQHGYDLMLGGWDNNGVCNAYYKDLIVAKRALSQAELDDIYNTKMIMTKDGGLQVQNSIITGQVI